MCSQQLLISTSCGLVNAAKDTFSKREQLQTIMKPRDRIKPYLFYLYFFPCRMTNVSRSDILFCTSSNGLPEVQLLTEGQKASVKGREQPEISLSPLVYLWHWSALAPCNGALWTRLLVTMHFLKLMNQSKEETCRYSKTNKYIAIIVYNLGKVSTTWSEVLLSFGVLETGLIKEECSLTFVTSRDHICSPPPASMCFAEFALTDCQLPFL